MALRDCRLNVHLLAPRTGPDRDRAHAQLRQAFQACVQRLGIDQPVHGLAAHPPGRPDETPDRGVVAARRRAGPAWLETYWEADHDLTSLSVSLSRAGQPDDGWAALANDWHTRVSDVDTDALVGVVWVYTALVDAGEMDPTAPELTTAVEQSLPTPPAPGWAASGALTRGGLVVWQASPSPSDSPHRSIVVLAPARADQQLGELVWTATAPLMRYLIHAAKLRYQARVLRTDLTGLQRQRHHAGEVLAKLRPIFTDAQTATAQTLADAQYQLAALQADETGLIDALLLTRTMRRTVAIAAANMAQIAADTLQDPHDPRGHLFNRDQLDATLLDQRLDDEITYLDAAGTRAQYFAAIADRELTRRAQLDAELAQRDAEAHRHRQERFAVIQAAVVGTALLALTALQALGYQIRLAGPAKPAAIAAIATAALWLSAIAFRLTWQHQRPPDQHRPDQHRPDQHRPGQRRQRRWPTVIEVLACGGFAASAGWLAQALLAGRTPWPPATVEATVGFATAAFLAGAFSCVVAALRRRHRSATRR